MTRDSSDKAAETRTTRMLAQSLHFTAQHDEAARLARQLMDAPRATTRRMGESSIDPQVSARVILARILWIQGRPDEAAAVAAEALVRAASDVGTSIAHAISWACLPVAFWRGDLPRVRALLDQLCAQCTAYKLPYWATWVGCYERALAAPPEPASAFDASVQPATPDLKQLDMLTTVAPGFATRQLLARAKASSAPWCAPEVLRASGELLLRRHGTEARAEAQALFEQGLHLAREQKAASWELRCAVSLGRLWQHVGRVPEAEQLVYAAYRSFHEGHATADLQEASALLAELTTRRLSQFAPHGTGRPA